MLLTARYVLPVAAPHIENGAVLVRDGVIVEVGHAIDLKTRYASEEVVDFGLAALMPGLIDCHTHLEYSVMRGILNDVPFAAWKAYVLEKESRMGPEDWDQSALLGAAEAISSGITTIADITETGASLRAAHAAGLRAVIYREVGSITRGEVEERIAEADRDIQEWRNHCDNNGRITVGIAPETLYTCHPEMLRAVREYASDGTNVAIHLAGSREEYDFIKYGSSTFAIDNRSVRTEAISAIQATSILPTGVTPVQYAANWGILDTPNIMCIHCVQLDDGDFETLANKGVSVVVCPRAEAKLSMGIPQIMRFRRHGIPVALGTDSPAAADSTDMIEEMHFTLLLQRALHPREDFLVAADMINMSTLEAARALGIDDKTGSLEPGKAADIIAIDLSTSRQVPTHYPNSAVVHTTDSEDIMMTMVDGEVLYQRPDFTSRLNMDEILNRAKELRIQLRA